MPSTRMGIRLTGLGVHDIGERTGMEVDGIAPETSFSPDPPAKQFDI